MESGAYPWRQAELGKLRDRPDLAGKRSAVRGAHCSIRRLNEPSRRLTWLCTSDLPRAATLLLEPVNNVAHDYDASRDYGAGCRGSTGRDEQSSATTVAASLNGSNLDRLKVHLL